mmetsp:Transcript_18453/g.51281  ORF Transcript_18453/g.51281 Transcript_18453/m.51281 type:complete len:292 (+) Transcript_18453:823-1698(+)
MHLAFLRHVHAVREHIAELGWRCQESRNFLRDSVGWCSVGPGQAAHWKASQLHHSAGQHSQRTGEVVGCLLQCILGFLLQAEHRVLSQHFESFDSSVSAVMMQGGVSQEHGPKGIGQASHEQLFELETSAESEAQVRRQCEVGRQTLQLVFVVLQELVAVLVGATGARRGADGGTHTTCQGTTKIGEPVLDDLVELLAEDLHTLLFLLLRQLQGKDEVQHVRVAAGQALANDLERSRHDVGTFDCDADWHVHVRVSKVVGVTTADGRPSCDVHSAFDDAPTALGTVLLHDG